VITQNLSISNEIQLHPKVCTFYKLQTCKLS